MRRFIYSALILLCSISAISQQAGFGFVVGVPRNDFRVATDAEGYGLNLTFLAPIGSEVVNLGANINYLVYGYNSRNQDLNADITSGGTTIGSINIPLRITNTNQIFGMHATMRITAPTEAVRPYIEGLFGFRYLATTTRIEDRDNFWNDDEDNVLVRRTNLDDWVLSYGGGGGLQIAVGESSFLDLRAYYLLGGKADFYDGSDTENWSVEFGGSNFDPNNIDPNEFAIGAQPRTSTTDMLMVQMGVTFKF